MRTFNLPQQRIIFVIIVCLIALSFFQCIPLFNLQFLTSPSAGIEEKSFPIILEIVGKVKKPGIYCFAHEVTLAKLIEKAGGLTSEIIFGSRYRSLKVPNGTKITIESTPPSVRKEMMGVHERLLYFIPININTASVEELVAVPGIGEKTAGAIIEYRKKCGDFLRLDDLRKVHGVGRSNFKKMRPHLTL